jgi:hypothetical protein
MRRMPCLAALSLILASTGPAAAQSLSSRPAIFADPLLTSDPTRGELVLGRTTLLSALRIFAVELQDTVSAPSGHRGNPDTVGTGFSFGPESSVRPYYRVDLGPHHYTLYFDRHQRLVAALADHTRLNRVLRREDLVARYATLRIQGAPAAPNRAMEWVIAELAPCVAGTARIWEGDDGRKDAGHLLPGTVVEFGYLYTCATTPPAVRAVFNWNQ